MMKKYTCLIVIFLIAASLITYGRIIGNGFIDLDDEQYITENKHVQSGINAESIQWAFTTTEAFNWHPLTWFSHMLDWRLFKDHAGGHHLISLLLHIGNVLLLFFFLNRTTKNLWSSAFVAAIFALHPLRVESVAWAAERKDVLSAFFGLAALYAYALYAEGPKFSRYIICLLLFALGLLAKPMLVTLPFVLMLLDLWPFERWQKALNPENMKPVHDAVLKKKKGKRPKVDSMIENKISAPAKSRGQKIFSLLWEKAPFVFLAIISSIVTFWAQNKGDNVASLQYIPLSERAVNAIISYASYLGKTFWPADLAVLYPYPGYYPLWQVLGSGLLLIVVSIAAIFTLKKAPFLLVGWFWYLGTLVPVIGLVQVGAQAMADRYTYLPSIGIGIMLAGGIPYLLKRAETRKKVLFPAGIAVIAILAVLTWRQCGYWKNSLLLFDHTLQITGNNEVVHYFLGNALMKKGILQEAVNHFQEALKIAPGYSAAHYNLGNALKEQGNMQEALKEFRETVRIKPDYADAHNNIGIILEMHFRKFDEAIYHYQQALKIDPNNQGVHFNLGVALAKNGQLKEAVMELQTALYLNPNHEGARRAMDMMREAEIRPKR